jgi:hypothetical protein
MWPITYVDPCNLQNWKNIYKKKKLMQLCNFITKCHKMQGNP